MLAGQFLEIVIVPDLKIEKFQFCFLSAVMKDIFKIGHIFFLQK